MNAPLAPMVIRAALEWQVTLWSGEETTEERAAFERWRTADPQHERAWQQLLQVTDTVGRVSDAAAGSVLRRAQTAMRRRTVLRGLGLAFGTGFLAYGMRETPFAHSVVAQYSTARGERLPLVLQDGSQVVLNTASAIDVQFDAAERRILLRAGEILVASARDSRQRPLIVSTRLGDVRPIGTRFTVRDMDSHAQVQVFEGAVEIAPRADDAGRLRIEAGRQARFDASSVARPVDLHPLASAWTGGLLVAERQRLDAFLRELGRYRNGVLRCDPAIGELIVSGVYPLTDTDRVLQLLQSALPIRVDYRTRYWVSIAAR